MDLETQARILTTVQNGAKPIVLLGAPDPESAELAALTVTIGDPTFAGPLAGVQLGLPVYHILEPEVEATAEPRSYEEHIALMKMALETDAITAVVQEVRGAHSNLD